MPKTKSLSLPTATSQAVSRVRRLMAGELVTANSRGDWDLATDTQLVITYVTYPPKHPAAVDARAALMTMPGVREVRIAAGHMTIVRER